MFFTRLTVAAALMLGAAAAATAAEPAPLRLTSAHTSGATAMSTGSGQYSGSQNGGTGSAQGSGGYPMLSAPLYPSPVQHTPPWTGGTIITNQAFAPHEMLYPHKYHAMYGPFYYKVRGKWVVTPFGVHQHEKWKLEGTQVKVKYHPHFKLFSGFHPPVSH